MLTYKQAKKIGTQACIDKLGRAFVKKHARSSSSAYGRMKDSVFCYVGVDDTEQNYKEDSRIILSSAPEDAFPYMASCNVYYADGTVKFGKCILPK